jgi:hypothetical protein
VQVIKTFPRPDSTKRLKSFLGTTSYYQKFIPNFSKIAAPLYLLLKGEAMFAWGGYQGNAFHRGSLD